MGVALERLPSCSLIITTYNWPAALNLVLQTVAYQTIIPQQVIVADDGSGLETKELMDSWKDRLHQLEHSWQEDSGFRLARSRNKALDRVDSDYVIIIDGDMVMEPHFVEDHLSFARQGSFVQGRRAILKAEPTERLLKEENWQWDAEKLKGGVRAAHKLKRYPLLSKLLGYRQYNAKHVRGCNTAFWYKDLVAINGFDSDFVGWGREDSDLAWRLINHGLYKRHLRYRAVALHLYHNEVSRAALPENDERRKRAMTDRSYTYCQNGLAQINQS